MVYGNPHGLNKSNKSLIMKIDQQKLKSVVTDLLKSVQEPYCVASSVALGRIEGCQIQITVTRDADDQMPNLKKFYCITSA